MAYVIVVSPEYGNAYRKDGDALMGTVILADGSISQEYDEWWEVALDDISDEERITILSWFENLNKL